jgi:heparinase II/III-like protein
MNLRDAAQELIELGPRGTVFRIGWELKGRAGLTKTVSTAATVSASLPSGDWTYRLQMEDPVALGRFLERRIPLANLERLRTTADEAAKGRILCFGRWTADFGHPIDWHRNPLKHEGWNPADPWFRARTNDRAGDVKYAWEAARFPHAYHLARAATFFPERADIYAAALTRQFESFIADNPAGFGIHWASGQEVGLRLLAWLFALDVLLLRTANGKAAEPIVAEALMTGARHIEEHLDYARIAVYNNHLLSEALALFAVGALSPEAPDALRWRELGRRILDEEAERQFYEDGGYIQQSHNYHRVALQVYLWACAFARSSGDSASPIWLRALERSLDLLLAHQNPVDGRLPNYGSNDGALPSILSTCDFADMRPELQAVGILVRGERLYDNGPWDESAAWLLGVRALDAPLRVPRLVSRSFHLTGYHVLRGKSEASFAAFRCGALRDRFSQIDMLHLDVWWRGLNVLVDPGSFQYNAAPAWHEHFMGTGSHNTIAVDGHDQMLHHRQFKVLYWTKAKLLAFRDQPAWTLCEGEHYGFQRHPGHAIHRRSILFVKDDLWVVVDRIDGSGEHDIRLQWLGGDFPWRRSAGHGMELTTPEGPFSVGVFAADGHEEPFTVQAGADTPPRGWLSRYYGEKVAVPSLVVDRRRTLPMTLVSILSGAPYTTVVSSDRWAIDQGSRHVMFTIDNGRFTSQTVR